VRHVRADPVAVAFPHGVMRNLILSAMSVANAPRQDSPRLLGSGVSGKLTETYLRRRLRHLRTGQVYELMCHPGHYDPDEIKEQRLIAYHDWESELRLLTSSSFHDMCADQGIRLIGYRDLPARELPVMGSANSLDTASNDTPS